jgi:hypothetical protein
MIATLQKTVEEPSKFMFRKVATSPEVMLIAQQKRQQWGKAGMPQQQLATWNWRKRKKDIKSLSKLQPSKTSSTGRQQRGLKISPEKNSGQEVNILQEHNKSQGDEIGKI